MVQKLSINDLQVHGKKVLMRVDFNVPFNDRQEIADDSRIQAALKSIHYVIDNGGSLVLMSHLGRPKGKDKTLSLSPCATRLSELLGKRVKMASDCVGREVEEQVESLKPGEILLLENLRFHPGEKKPEEDPSFVKQLAKLGDFYVNDAFGSAHRKHASTCVIADYFPGKAAAGFLMEKEIAFLGEALSCPKRPFVALIGGAKVSTKLGVLHSLLSKVDSLLIGGGMAYTFFKAKGIQIGDSICEDDLIEQAKEILASDVKIILPFDIVAADQVKENAKTTIVEMTQGIPLGFEGVDIGPKTIKLFEQALKPAKTILWNGPVGVFEIDQFAEGTNQIAKIIGSLDATTIVGGGDSVAALKKAGLDGQISHLSTGGGACLEYIENGKLPGIEALSDLKNA